jgi:hypothetical protein
MIKKIQIKQLTTCENSNDLEKRKEEAHTIFGFCHII